ncbi:MAG: hypothetical protein HQ541_03160 [Mariniphaga sp.]|nr:hypothetical protein [Mariniphaga sp.]
MNRLVIIGNGFDLSLGLKTSYKDFLFHFIKKNLIEFLDSDEYGKHVTFYTDIGNVHELKNNKLIKLRIPEHKSINSILTDIEDYDTYNDLSEYLIENKFLSYKIDLLNIIHQKSVNDNWIDIEISYYDKLIEFIKSRKPIRNYNEKFGYLKLELIKYLNSVDKLITDIHSNRLERLFDYHSNFLEGLFQSNNKDSVKVNEIMVLNFNYTFSLERINKIIPINKSLEINHIHGNLHDKDSIIFGFGDEHDKDYNLLKSGRSNEQFRYTKKSYYSLYPNKKKLNSFINSDKYEVYILGHSCGISDRTLLNNIFENDLCKSIRIFHKNKNSSQDYLNKIHEIGKYFDDTKGKILPFDKNDTIHPLKTE